MIAGLLSKFGRIHIAQTREEKEAVYRFRYQIYIEELRYTLNNADHERRWIFEPKDEEEGTFLFYVGTPDAMTGTLRCRYWPENKVPKHIQEKYSLHLFPDINRRRIVETSMLVVKNTLFSKFMMIALIDKYYDFFAEKMKVDFNFSSCIPSFIPWYKAFGFHTYSGDFIQTEFGIEIPLVLISSNVEYFKKIKSPLLSRAKKYFKTPDNILQKEVYHKLFDENKFIIQSPEKILEILFNHVSLNEKYFLNSLSREVLELLVQHGSIFNVPKDRIITHENVRERELFVVIKGVLEVSVREKVIATLNEGEIFGEIALFRDPGVRTATVKTLTGAQLFMLRPQFMEETLQNNPTIAAEILLQFGRVMADRIVSANQFFLSSALDDSFGQVRT